MANSLAIETSSPVLSIALKTGDSGICEAKLVGFHQHAENILPMIGRLLKQKRVTIHDIDAFLIGIGPGSFTGLRVGFSTLKGFLSLAKKPCFGALSLDMIAGHITLPEGSELAVCLDAKRERIYSRFYRYEARQWKPLTKAGVYTVPDLMAELPEKVVIAGDAIARYGDEILRRAKPGQREFLPESLWYPRAATLTGWFEEQNAKLHKLEKPKDFSPLYFRLSEAEERRRERKLCCR